MSFEIDIEIRFAGSLAEEHFLDAYDAGAALSGLHRIIALSTHLALNGEIIVQAPSLKGAKIFSAPPQPGSWKSILRVVGLGVSGIAGAVYFAGTAPKDTPIGHFSRSLYDYIIFNAFGVQIDYEKTIRQQVEELKDQHPHLKKIDESKLESLTEKCQSAIRDLHRPIYASQTAQEAFLTAKIGRSIVNIGPKLDVSTFEDLDFVYEENNISEINCQITSYNNNTFHGRIYIDYENRTIPFDLSRYNRELSTLEAIADSLHGTITRVPYPVTAYGYKRFNKGGKLKGFRLSSAIPART